MNDGLEKRQSNLIFVNINKEGELSIKSSNGEINTYSSITGVINKVEFKMEQYEGRDSEKAKIYIQKNNTVYCLQMTLSTGYFKGFCNSLRSSEDPRAEVKISPSLRKDEKGKSKATCFVSQNGKALKHAFTMANRGNFPELKVTEFRGQKLYDDTDQLFFWKTWLLSLFEKYEHSEQHQTNVSQTQPAAQQAPEAMGQGFNEMTEPIDDLPF